jgi:hypothetical protein
VLPLILIESTTLKMAQSSPQTEGSTMMAGGWTNGRGIKELTNKTKARQDAGKAETRSLTKARAASDSTASRATQSSHAVKVIRRGVSKADEQPRHVRHILLYRR